MFFELRQYRCRPGRRDEWAKWMDEVVIPYQIGQGMVIVGAFTCPDEPDLYVWMRRFESEEQREQLYAATYQSEIWQQEMSPIVEQLIFRDQIKVTRLAATPRSVIR